MSDGDGANPLHSCAHGLQNLRLLNGCIIGHHDVTLTPEGSGDHRKTHAGASNRALCDQVAGVELALRQGIFHYVESYTIFDTSTRVEKLSLP